MLANNNRKVCRTLVRRGGLHRGKNGILILAAALVAALYTFVFLLGSSVESAYLLNYQYSYGSTSHILYTGLTDRQADTIAANARVKNTVRLSTVGQITDPMIGQRRVKLAVTDRDYAETVLSVPAAGRLPEKKGEIALDEFTMDSLGVLHEPGALVAFLWTDPDGNEHSSEFTLCGWWVSSAIFTEACAWISAQTAQELLPGYQDETKNNVTLGVNLHQPGNLEEQAAALLEEQGIAGAGFTTNLAFNEARREMAKQQAMPFYSPAVPVLLCGFLMIYSIVQVTAQNDLLYYAGLKSLGMTPGQLGYLLFAQGCAVSLPGLLPGWILGFGIHYLITGRLIIGMDENPALYFLSWPPFALAALGTFVTVLLAYLLPGLRLFPLTPVQTACLAAGRVRRPKDRADGSITLARVALRTLSRGRLRTLLSTLSLLLALLVISSVWIQYASFRKDIYLDAISPWDYTITDGSAYLYAQRYNEKNTGITEETVQTLQKRPEVLRVSALKSHEVLLTASEKLCRRIVDYYNQPYDETMTLRESQAGYPEWCDGLDRLEQSLEYVGLVIGLDGDYLQYVLDNCPFTSGSFDAEAFASGDYVLAAGAYHEGISAPAAGETVELQGRTYHVMGSLMHDNAYINGANSVQAAFHIAYLMPPEQFDELFPGQAYRQLAVDIDPWRQDEFESCLDQYEQGLNRGVGIMRRSESEANFEAARLNMLLPKLVVALVLLGIALINFVNMLAVRTVSRKAEFAVYESLGMTAAQLRRLTLLEGIFHAGLTVLVLVPSVVFFSAAVMPSVVEAAGSWCMVYRFSLLPLWLALPVILSAAVAVPPVCLRFVTKGSLTGRLRRI